MSPRRRISTGSASTPSEEPERAVSAELGELRALVTHLVVRSFRQDQRLEQLFAQRGDLAVEERDWALVQRTERKRPALDVDGQASSRRWPRLRDRCIFCGGPHLSHTCDLRWGRCFKCGQSGHLRATCPLPTSTAPPSALAPIASQQRSRPRLQRQQQQQRQPWQADKCIFCEGQHPSSTCEQMWGRYFKCAQFGHIRATCLSGTVVVPTSVSVPTTLQRRLGASPIDLQADRASPPHPCGEGQSFSSGQDCLAQTEVSAIADRVMAGMIYSGQ